MATGGWRRHVAPGATVAPTERVQSPRLQKSTVRLGGGAAGADRPSAAHRLIWLPRPRKVLTGMRERVTGILLACWALVVLPGLCTSGATGHMCHDSASSSHEDESGEDPCHQDARWDAGPRLGKAAAPAAPQLCQSVLSGRDAVAALCPTRTARSTTTPVPTFCSTNPPLLL